VLQNTRAHLEVSPSGSDGSMVTRSSGESLSGGCGSKSPSPSRLSDHGASLASMDSLSKIIPPEKGCFRKESGNDLVPRKRRVSGPASIRKSSLEPSGLNKSEDGFLDAGKSFDEARDQLEDSFFPTCRPPGGKRISCREDSVESSGQASFLNLDPVL